MIIKKITLVCVILSFILCFTACQNASSTSSNTEAVDISDIKDDLEKIYVKLDGISNSVDDNAAMGSKVSEIEKNLDNIYSKVDDISKNISTEEVTTAKPPMLTAPLVAYNASLHLNVRLIFGNVERTGSGLTCMGYIVVSPRHEYIYTDCSVTVRIKSPLALSNNWWYANTTMTILQTTDFVINLDHDGNGYTSVCFYNSGDGVHPLTNGNYTCTIINATGTVGGRPDY